MPRLATYLNTLGQTEEAFTFYASVFAPGAPLEIHRFAELAGGPGMPPLPAEDLDKVLHVRLELPDGHLLLGTDILASTGQQVRVGNNTTIAVLCDSREEADRYYDALAEGGSESTGMADMAWGDYWGCTLDRFSIRWMLTHQG